MVKAYFDLKILKLCKVPETMEREMLLPGIFSFFTG